MLFLFARIIDAIPHDIEWNNVQIFSLGLFPILLGNNPQNSWVLCVFRWITCFFGSRFNSSIDIRISSGENTKILTSSYTRKPFACISEMRYYAYLHYLHSDCYHHLHRHIHNFSTDVRFGFFQGMEFRIKPCPHMAIG